MLSLRGRPEIEHTSLAVEEPLAGLVQFLQHVEEAKALAFAEAIKPERRGGLDQPVLEVNRGHPLVGVGPIPRPVAVDPKVAGVLPLPWAVAAVKESLLQLADLATVLIFRGARLRDPGDLLPRSFVGPTR